MGINAEAYDILSTDEARTRVGSTLCGYSTREFPNKAAVNKSLVISEQAEVITVKAPH